MNKTKKASPSRWRVFRRFAVTPLMVVALLFAPLIGVLSYGVYSPDWVKGRFEARVNASLGGMRIEIGDIAFRLFAHGANPTVTVGSVRVFDEGGHLRAVLPEIDSELSGPALLWGQLRPVNLRVRSASFRLLRDSEGRFDVNVGQSDTPEGETEVVDSLDQSVTPGDIISWVEAVLDLPLLRDLESATASDTAVFVEDALSQRTWQFHHGKLTLENGPSHFAAGMRFQLANLTGRSAEASFSFKKVKGANTSDFSTRFRGLRTVDVADQVVAFDWLRVLDAPIAGSMSLNLEADGTFGDLFGVLDIGAGKLSPGGETRPVKFSGAKAYLNYERDKEKLTFNQVSINTDAARIEAEGHLYLSDRIDRSIGAIIGQFKFTKVTISDAGLFDEPVRFDLGALDMRVRLDPFQVDIGQMVLVDRETRVVLRGVLAADQTGWTSALDLTVNALNRDQILRFWPKKLKPRTRQWVSENVLAGAVSNFVGALRGSPGEKPRLSAGFDIDGASVRFMKTLPPIHNGKGYAVLAGQQMDFVAQQGLITAPSGGDINIAGSSMTIHDVTIREAPAEIDLKTQSSITSILSLLDLEPFQFLQKAGLSPDLASGVLKGEGTIGLPLSKKVRLDQVSLQISATASKVSTDKLVKGKTLRADSLNVFVDDAGLTISGDARLGVVPVSGTWAQKFGPEFKGISRVDGQIELSQAFLNEFGIVLPEGAVKGRGRGTIAIDLTRNKPPAFSLISDLNRVQVKLEAVGYLKPKNQTGRLEVRGRFGSPPEIDHISLKTRGLEAEGTVALTRDGKLKLASFDKVNVGDWLNTKVEIRPGADGNADFELSGGSLDMRRSQFGATAVKGNGSQIGVAIDRVTLSTGIALRNVRGDFSTGGGFSGSFSGTVNGGAPLVGTLASQGNGTAVRFTSEDAGAVFRSSGLFDSAVGGRLDMILTPSGESGVYLGQMKGQQIRVRNATALADILSAISVVGLLEQLGGEGIMFNTVDARFRLTPNTVHITESSAVGASLGLTMEGVYDFAGQTMDLQGVVTPIYVLNGLLEQTKIFGGLFGKQKGEGLFGFNYTLRGPVAKPKVGVNPLSILTPGLFREIFRRPIPEPEE